MTTLREAAQQALEILERLHGGCTDSDDGTVEAITVWCPDVIDALRAALAEPVQEPVAWMYWGDNGDGTESKYVHIGREFSTYWKPIRPPTPLYTSPPQRKPLTEKEIEDLRFSFDFYQRRCEALQAWQSKMRDPERTIVCDILANGFTLDPAFAGDRYTSPPQRKPLTEEEIEDLYFDNFSMGELKAFARAIERAHGIGEKE